ncbi:AbiJ-NTD4 domain-containing protein [Ancylobacter sp. G4_0304]|uniref:AbiJ-NTD4 domain-containing protein n=1 Tax=Ancylobacter sp. G4_0304 TaxID=3114289 RepID=UPI0039C67F9F
MDRKSLTFEQAEGVEPLPSQLNRKDVSPRVRATIWAVLEEEIRTEERPYGKFGPLWFKIFRNEYAFRQGRPIDEFVNSFASYYNKIKSEIMNADYIQVFGFLQWVIRDPSTPKNFITEIAEGLAWSHAAYRLIDGDTLVPVSDPLVTEALERAMADARSSGMGAGLAHLRSAIDQLATDQYANSVRESIHAVEAVALRLNRGSKTLGTALTRLEANGTIHEAMKKGFSALYGYTNDERGIRHSLIEGEAAKVDEADALFMLGACAAFVSYLIAKGQAAGLMK